MFNLVYQFWLEIYQVFLPPGYCEYFAFNTAFCIDGTCYWTPNTGLNVFGHHVCQCLAGLTLIGLSVFLFYQVYKVVHAFVGGFYEDDL